MEVQGGVGREVYSCFRQGGVGLEQVAAAGQKQRINQSVLALLMVVGDAAVEKHVFGGVAPEGVVEHHARAVPMLHLRRKLHLIGGHEDAQFRVLLQQTINGGEVCVRGLDPASNAGVLVRPPQVHTHSENTTAQMLLPKRINLGLDVRFDTNVPLHEGARSLPHRPVPCFVSRTLPHPIHAVRVRANAERPIVVQVPQRSDVKLQHVPRVHVAVADTHHRLEKIFPHVVPAARVIVLVHPVRRQLSEIHHAAQPQEGGDVELVERKHKVGEEARRGVVDAHAQRLARVGGGESQLGDDVGGEDVFRGDGRLPGRVLPGDVVQEVASGEPRRAR
mmetsp:Transcript_42083/g.78737  ORF Transcript_42083/g.78737 Transcript_42083/m.78737 type:complete len:334 (-) Transcript_42083:584-1585(-)